MPNSNQGRSNKDSALVWATGVPNKGVFLKNVFAFEYFLHHDMYQIAWTSRPCSVFLCFAVTSM